MRHQYRFLAQKSEQGWTIDEAELHHLRRVLRLQTGDQVEFFDGVGHTGEGTLLNQDGLIEVQSIVQQAPPKHLLTTAVGVLRPSHADELIPQLVETGAQEVVFFMQEGTSKQFISPKVQQRWERIALSSARQCKRPFLMKIRIFNNLEDVIGCVQHFCAKIHLAPGAKSSLLDVTGSAVGDTCIVIGSEKGLLADEVSLLRLHGFEDCHLGSGVLRAVTAATLATGIAAMRIAETP